MKKVFGFFVGIALLLTTVFFASCSLPYTGRYYDVNYIPDVTEAEYAQYNAAQTPAAKLVRFMDLSNTKPNTEAKKNLTDIKLISYLYRNGVTRDSAKNIVNELSNKPDGYGILTYYYYYSNSSKFYDLYFIQVKD